MVGEVRFGTVRSSPTRNAASVLAAILLAASMTSCRCDGVTEDRPERADSSAIPDRLKRVEIAGRTLKLVTPIDDAAFVIFDTSGRRSLAPGPSDWDMVIVMRVGRDRLPAWDAAYRSWFEQTDTEPDLTRIRRVLTANGWPEPRGRPRIFHASAHGFRAVFEDDGLIAVQDSTFTQ